MHLILLVIDRTLMSRSGWIFHPMNLSFLAASPRYLPIKATSEANIVLYINIYNVMVEYLGFKQELLLSLGAVHGCTQTMPTYYLPQYLFI